MQKSLHIIVWDIPFPANYGGVVDVFYKLNYLHKAGVSITLHCFQYAHREQMSMLNQYCEAVHYYPRITGFKGLHHSLPYIVSSRKSDALLANLCVNNAPILFEGIHTTYYLNHEKLKTRKKYLRTHNVEHDYYVQLAQHATLWFKKIYFYWEAKRLKRVEANLNTIDGFIEIALHDYDYFKKKYPNKSHLYSPGFQQLNEVQSQLGKSDYCLYHGNLSIAENEKAALFLIKEVFTDLKIPLRIAGKNPSIELLKCQTEFIQIIANPSDTELYNLIKHAHIHVLPSFQSTGLKLKLLHALFLGRFCIVNNMILEGTQIRTSVSIANKASDFKNEIIKLMITEFSTIDFQNRVDELAPYLPSKNAKAITEFMFEK
jgi:glycosyltransferase involved in cell wall biosynthesis